MPTSIHEGKAVEQDAPQTDKKDKKKGPAGQSWSQKEVHDIPKNNLIVVFLGLMLTVFLAALDQTIVSTALPVIVTELPGTGYTWIGAAYLLAASAMTPLSGKICDSFGAKYALFIGIAIFLIGSALCGAAQTMTWLCVCRGVAGIGGGLLMTSCQIIISQIVSLEKRGKYGGALGATWGIASPSLVDLLRTLVNGDGSSDKRPYSQIIQRAYSCLTLNLPTGALAAGILFWFLNLNPVKQKSWKQHAKELDYIGIVLIIGGIVMFLLGLVQGEEGNWSEPQTIALLTVGLCSLVGAAVNEIYTKQVPIISPRLFKTRTTGLILVSTVLHAIVFFTGSFYLPLYYQILGSSATMAGIRTLPYSLGSSFSSVLGGLALSKFGEYKTLLIICWATFCIGQGTMILLDSESSVATQTLTTLVAAIGLGPMFQAPLIALQAAMPVDSIASATSAYAMLRTTSGALGVTLGGTIYGNSVTSRLRSIPSFNINAEPGSSSSILSIDVASLNRIQPLEVRRQVLEAFAQSIRLIWIVDTPLVFVGLVCVCFLRRYTLQRQVVTNGGDAKVGSEKASEPAIGPVEIPGVERGDVER